MNRLPLADRVLYGLGSLGNAALFWFMGTWIQYFYSPPEQSGRPELLPLWAIGLAFGVGRIVEAFDDPLIGWWSDRTRHRWGRRIPFLLVGTPLLSLSFWLLWNPPYGASLLLTALTFFVVLELFYFANTIVGAPYEALQAEIALTSDDRVSCGVWKVLFGTLGLVVALVVGPQLIERLGFSGAGAALATIALVALYAMLFGLWRRGTLRHTSRLEAASVTFGASVRASLGHRPFLALAASYLFFSIGYSVLNQLMPYYVSVVHHGSEGDVTFFLGGLVAAVLLALPLSSRAASAFGKRAVYAASMLTVGIYLCALSVLAFMPLLPGIAFDLQSKIAIALSGLGFAALFVFPGAMIGDIVDDDARRSGQQRAAAYYGMFKMIEKLAQGLAVFVFTIIGTLFGYSGERTLGLQLAFPVAGLLALAGCVTILVAYKLPEQRSPVTSRPSLGDA